MVMTGLDRTVGDDHLVASAVTCKQARCTQLQLRPTVNSILKSISRVVCRELSRGLKQNLRQNYTTPNLPALIRHSMDHAKLKGYPYKVFQQQKNQRDLLTHNELLSRTYSRICPSSKFWSPKLPKLWVELWAREIRPPKMSHAVYCESQSTSKRTVS